MSAQARRTVAQHKGPAGSSVRGCCVIALLLVFAVAGCAPARHREVGGNTMLLSHRATDHPVLHMWELDDRPKNGLGADAGRLALVDTGVSNALVRDCSRCLLEVHGEGVGDESGHGTAITALLTGVPSLHFPGLIPDVVIGVFGVAPTHGDLIRAEQIARAIDRAVIEGYAVINISLGSQTPDVALRLSIERALEAGAIVIAAAGEDPGKTALYPASFPGVISVYSAPHRHEGQEFALDKPNRNDGIFVPIGGVRIPRFDSENESFHLGTSEESSEASAILSAMALVHRALADDCYRLPSLREFLAQGGRNLGAAKPIMSGVAEYCDEVGVS